jgi:hypothetical protein
VRICPVIAPQVVTVSAVLRRPAPAMRTQTFASVLEMSIRTAGVHDFHGHPPHIDIGNKGVRHGEGREKNEV